MTGAIRLGNAAGSPPVLTGGLANVTEVDSTSYMALLSDDVILVSNAGGHATVTLPTAIGCVGKQFEIVKTNDYEAVYLCNIDCAVGGQTISGVGVRTLAGYGETLRVSSDGANWQISGGNQAQFRTPKEWFVGGPVYAGITGRSPRTAFQTLTQAMAAAQSGDTIYVCDALPINAEGVVIDKSVRIAGLGNRPELSLVGAAGDYDFESYVLKITEDNVQLENLTIKAPANWTGTCVISDMAARGSYRQLDIGPVGGTPTAYPTSAGAGTGHGGLGIVFNGGEGNYLEQILFGACSIGLVVGHESSTNEVNRMVTSSCYQGLVMGMSTNDGGTTSTVDTATFPFPYGGGNGGGWTFINCKNTAPVGATLTPSVELIGDGTDNYIGANNGQNTFINCDYDESGYESHVRIGSAGNTFIRFTSSPQTVFYIAGQRNTFINSRILGAGWVVNGDHNSFDDVYSNGTITGSGSHCRFKRAVFGSSTTLPLAMTGTDNTFDDNCVFGAYVGAADVVLADLGPRPKFECAEAVVALAYSPTVATDVRLGTHFTLAVTNGTAFTISNPTDSGNAVPANIMVTKKITYDILNSSGGTMGDVTFDTHFKLAGAFTKPANGKRRTITFQIVDATTFVEVGRAQADI